ncbi:NUDIX hydrolase [Nocardiopsis changdeensis]|uniref:NUDIX hydrolase n=1 Tax=Nocardiopsis changdeensis TaxID=2831969 RepID=UPI003F4475B9
MPWICDGKSAGTLIYDRAGRLLTHTRATAPSGIALGACGHVDDVTPGATHTQAAVRETEEEYGLTVREADMDLVFHRWLPNRCGAHIPAAPRGGHEWAIYRARVWSGQVKVAPDEVLATHWCTPGQMQVLADRTVDYVHGRIGEDTWQTAPGIEPVWVYIGQMLGLFEVPDPRDLAAVLHFTETPPTPVR